MKSTYRSKAVAVHALCIWCLMTMQGARKVQWGSIKDCLGMRKARKYDVRTTRRSQRVRKAGGQEEESEVGRRAKQALAVVSVSS